MAQLSQCLGLYLADALPGDAEIAADLLQGAAAAVFQPESQLKDLCLALAQCEQHIVNLLFEELIGCRLCRRKGAAVLYEVP